MNYRYMLSANVIITITLRKRKCGSMERYREYLSIVRNSQLQGSFKEHEDEIDDFEEIQKERIYFLENNEERILREINYNRG